MTKTPRYFTGGLKSFILNPFFITRYSLYKYIKKHKKQIKGKVLDFGCGEKPYQSIFEYKEYIGLDYEKSGHDNIKNQIEVFWDGEKIPFNDKCFDSIICTETLEHVFDINKTLKELHRVLKTGGKILITIPFCMDEHEQPYDFARYTSFGIKSILEKNKFNVITQEKTTNYGQAILQLTRMYIGKTLKTNSQIINNLLKIIIFPIHILINSLYFITPGNKDFYFNQIIIAEKNE